MGTALSMSHDAWVCGCVGCVVVWLCGCVGVWVWVGGDNPLRNAPVPDGLRDPVGVGVGLVLGRVLLPEVVADQRPEAPI